MPLVIPILVGLSSVQGIEPVFVSDGPILEAKLKRWTERQSQRVRDIKVRVGRRKRKGWLKKS